MTEEDFSEFKVIVYLPKKQQNWKYVQTLMCFVSNIPAATDLRRFKWESKGVPFEAWETIHPPLGEVTDALASRNWCGLSF